MPATDQWKQFVDQVKSKVDIVDIIGEDVEFKQSGSVMKACSPFRDERTPSFVCWPDSQHWKDYSGGSDEGGDVYDYLMQKHGMTLREAVLHLASKLGLTPPEDDLEEVKKELMLLAERRKVEKLLTQAAAFYHKTMPSKIRREYYHEGYGLTDKTIDELKLGYANGDLAEYFQDAGVPEELALKTGLFIRIRSGGYKDYFQNRLFLPYWRNGRVVYAIGRQTKYTEENDYEKAKYKKLPKKSDSFPYISETISNEYFYNEDAAASSGEMVLITEGVTDCIAAMQAGIPTISPVTVNFRKEDAPKLLRLSTKFKKIVICNDNEEAQNGGEKSAGEKGAENTATALMAAGRDVRIAVLPRAEGVAKVDVNSFLIENKPEALQEILSKAQRFHDYLLERIPANTPAANLDKALEPVAKAIATLGPIEQDDYVDRIQARFDLKRKAVTDLLRKAGAQVKGEQKAIEKQKQKKQQKSGDDDFDFGGNGGGDGTQKIIGEISEGDNHYYRMGGKHGDDLEVISNFILEPTKRVNMEDGSALLSVNIVNTMGRRLENIVLPHEAFRSKKELVAKIPWIDFQWTGDDNNVQGLAAVLSRKNIPERVGTSTLGFYRNAEGEARWVLPGAVYSPSGEQTDDIAYVDGKGSLQHRLGYKNVPMEDVRATAQKVLPLLSQINEEQVIYPMIGWFFATPLKKILMEMVGSFPILFIWGTQGAGKSETTKVFWRLFGMKDVLPYSVTEPEFALISLLSCTDTVPVFLDEYKPRDMGKVRVERLGRFLRRIYGGETEERGRPDLSVVSYKLTTPLALGGEARPENDPALNERLITVNPSKNHLIHFPEHQAYFNEIRGLDLNMLSLAYAQFALSRDIQTDMDDVKALVADILTRAPGGKGMSPRFVNNINAMTLGLAMYMEFADAMGAKIPTPNLEGIIHRVVADLIDGDQGAKDGFDNFMERVSVLAQMGYLQHGRQYTVKDGMLYLHLATTHAVYQIEQKRAGLEDETNGPRALRRIIKEKVDKGGGYVVATDQEVDFGNGRKVRCEVINTLKIPKGLEIDPFPTEVQSSSGWGQPRLANDFDWGVRPVK